MSMMILYIPINWHDALVAMWSHRPSGRATCFLRWNRLLSMSNALVFPKSIVKCTNIKGAWCFHSFHMGVHDTSLDNQMWVLCFLCQVVSGGPGDKVVQESFWLKQLVKCCQADDTEDRTSTLIEWIWNVEHMTQCTNTFMIVCCCCCTIAAAVPSIYSLSPITVTNLKSDPYEYGAELQSNRVPPWHPDQSEPMFRFAGRAVGAPPWRCWSSSL